MQECAAPSSVAAPFRARFRLQETLAPYGLEDLALIVERAAPRLGVSVSSPALQAIARRSRRTPREALRLLERARDLATVAARTELEESDVEEAARRLGIDAGGLGPDDRRILALLVSRGRPLGLEAMAAALRLDPLTVKHVHEPYLVEEGYVPRGPRGREATARARRRLALEPPARDGEPRGAEPLPPRNGGFPTILGIPIVGTLRSFGRS